MGLASHWDLQGTILKGLCQVAWGYYPLLEIKESYPDYDTDYEGRAFIYGRVRLTIDTERLHLLDDFALSYVEHLIEGAIKNRLINPKDDVFNTETSRKYSFGDSMDWWDDIIVNEGDPQLGSRSIYNLDITLA